MMRRVNEQNTQLKQVNFSSIQLPSATPIRHGVIRTY